MGSDEVSSENNTTQKSFILKSNPNIYRFVEFNLIKLLINKRVGIKTFFDPELECKHILIFTSKSRQYLWAILLKSF